MAISFSQLNIPNTSRNKYGDYPNAYSGTTTSSASGGGGSVGGVGTTEYLTGWATDTGDTAGAWTITGFNYLQDLTDGTSIKVKFTTGPAAANQLNTLDIGIASENTAITSTTKVVFLENNEPLIVGENINPDTYLKAGDEYFLTYRLEAGYVNGSLVDGWIMERSNDSYARQLFTLTGDSANTFIQANENFYSVKDVAAHGSGGTQSSIQSVVDNLSTDSQTDALSARQGMILYSGLTGKQDTIIFTGNNATLKTINGQSLQGPGNLIIQGGEGTGGTYYYEGTGITINTANTISVSEPTWNLINSKYDKTGGTVSGSVIALQEISAYGAGGTQSSVQSVIDNLSSTSQTDALSANQGRILNNSKQATLVSGVNIKTINGYSLLGEGNIVIQGGGGTGGTEYNAGTGITISSDTISISQSTWQYLDSKYDKTGGTVSGSVIALQEISAYGAGGTQSSIQSVVDNLETDSQYDALSARQGMLLNNALTGKQDTLVSGTNIKTINGQSLVGAGNIIIQGGEGTGGTTYFAGANIGIVDNVISVTGITGSSLPSLTAGTASYAVNAGKLGNHTDDYFVNTATTQTISGVKTFNENIIGMKDISAHGSGGTQSSVQSVIDSITTTASSITAVSATDALSYRQGVVLNNKITGLTSSKQDKLVSGTNIKTINGQSLLGSGNITIEGGGGGGTTYYAGANISIAGNIISVTGITAGTHAQMTAGYASALGTSSSNYTKATLDTALGNKLGKTETAADSTKWGGYKIVVGSIGSASDTIYFGT